MFCSKTKGSNIRQVCKIIIVTTTVDINFCYKMADEEKCDIFKGEWIEDPRGPRYTNESCQILEAHQNCMKNGRPDTAYLHWRWNPRDCQLPSFNPHQFLHLMRNKSWAFIGDSISRNHVQSLICILSQVYSYLSTLQ